ncbi:kinetoplast DNA-associated protein, partial [Trypanosoma theileri]
MLRFGVHFVLTLFWIFAFFPSNCEATDVSQRCHIDSNLYSGKATSRGKWMDIAYNIVYDKGLCTTNDEIGVLDATINGVNKTLEGREGSISFDNVALVRFSLTSGINGKEFFFSELCWSSSNCTTLCSSELFGTTSSCVVKNVGAYIIIALIVLVPLVICLVLLYISWTRIKLRNRNKITEIEDNHQVQVLSRGIPTKEQYSESPTTVVHIKPTCNSNDTPAHTLQVGPTSVEVASAQIEVHVLEEEHSVKKNILKEGTSNSFPNDVVQKHQLLQQQQHEYLPKDRPLTENINLNTHIHDGFLHTEEVTRGELEMALLHDVNGVSRHMMER